MQSLVGAEVLDAAEHFEFLGVEENWVVASVVRLDVVRGEPWVLEALRGTDPLLWVLVQHLADQVLG